MPTPLKYNRTSVTDPETGVRVTNNNRQKAYRLRKAGHVEDGVCPVCSKKYCRQVRCEEFDDLTLRGAVVKAEYKKLDILYAFMSIKDYGKAKAAFKRAIM